MLSTVTVFTEAAYCWAKTCRGNGLYFPTTLKTQRICWEQVYEQESWITTAYLFDLEIMVSIKLNLRFPWIFFSIDFNDEKMVLKKRILQSNCRFSIPLVVSRKNFQWGMNLCLLNSGLSNWNIIKMCLCGRSPQFCSTNNNIWTFFYYWFF